jgi:hypothetical protein
VLSSSLNAVEEEAAPYVYSVQEVEHILRELAPQLTSKRLDDTLSLVKAEAHGTTFRINYHVHEPSPLNLEENHARQMENALNDEGSLRLIKAGAVFEFFYSRPNGEEFGLITIDHKALESYAAEGALSPLNRISSHFIEDRAKDMVAQQTLPYRLNNNTLITNMEANGTTLRTTYQVANPDVAGFRAQDTLRDLAQMNCSPALTPYIRAGAVLEFVYTRVTGETLFLAIVDRVACEAMADAG